MTVPLLLLASAVMAGCGRAVALAPASAPSPSAAASEGKLRPVLPPRPSPAGPLDASITEDDLEELWVRQMMVPVEGVLRKSLRDNYTAKRAKGIHGALDIFAPRNTPVVAASDHIIGRLSTGPVGGTVIYATDPEMRFTFYYAHLQRYRRGLAVGDRIAKGSIIGYVGTTGNAPDNLPHLHFQVMKRGTRAWWDGPAINPFPFFAADGLLADKNPQK